MSHAFILLLRTKMLSPCREHRDTILLCRSGTDAETSICVLHNAAHFKSLHHSSGRKNLCRSTRPVALPSSQYEARAGASDRSSHSPAQIYRTAAINIGRAVEISTNIIVVDARTNLLRKLLNIVDGATVPNLYSYDAAARFSLSRAFDNWYGGR